MSIAPVFFRLSAVAALACSAAFADTITLNSGEKVEGKVTKETATELTVEVKISAGVTDEQVIPKANVAKIEKEQPDELAWLPLRNIKLGQNSLQSTQYDALLRPLQAFVNDFPQSSHAVEANQLLAQIAGEKTRVDAGEVRMGDKWLTADEVGKERYQIQSQLAVQYLRSQRAAGDLTGALNTFDLIEKSFPGAQNFPDAVEVARETIAALKVAVERAQQVFQTKKAEFEAGLANASAVQKPQLLAARQRELAGGEAALAAAEKAKLKWPAFVPSSDKVLEAIVRKLPTETARLAGIDIAKLRQSAQLAEQGRKQLEQRNPEAADSFTKALQLSNKNELAHRLQPDANALKTSLAAASQAAAQAAAAEARATPTPKAAATPRPRVASADVPQAEPEKPFFLTIGGIVTIVILLALGFAGWATYNKLRHRANDVLE